MKKILFLTLLIVTSIYSNETINENKHDIKKELSFLKSEISNKNISYSKQFEYGYFYGHLLKDNPEIEKKLVELFKKSKDKDCFSIILKYANIKNKYFYHFRNFKIIDPLKYEKPYTNTIAMMVGEYKYTKDTKYLDKLNRFSQYDDISKYALTLLRKKYPEADKYLISIEPKEEKIEEIVIQKEKNSIPEDEIIKTKTGEK